MGGLGEGSVSTCGRISIRRALVNERRRAYQLISLFNRRSIPESLEKSLLFDSVRVTMMAEIEGFPGILHAQGLAQYCTNL